MISTDKPILCDAVNMNVKDELRSPDYVVW